MLTLRAIPHERRCVELRVDELRVRRRTGFGHDDFHAVVHFDELEFRHISEAEEMIAPGLLSVTGMAVENTDMGRIRGVFKKVEPAVIAITHRLDLSLAAAV